MLLHETNGVLTVSSPRRHPSRPFCNSYRRMAAAMVTPDTLALEPVVVGPGEITLRTPLYPEEHMERYDGPELFSAVHSCLGHQPRENTVLVLVPAEHLLLNLPEEGMTEVLASDIAAILAEESPLDGDADFGWAAKNAHRMTMGMLLLRAHGVTSPDAYLGLWSTEIRRMLAERYKRENGLGAFLRDNPGLMAMLDAIREDVFLSDPLPGPCSVDALVDASTRLITDRVSMLAPVSGPSW